MNKVRYLGRKGKAHISGKKRIKFVKVDRNNVDPRVSVTAEKTKEGLEFVVNGEKLPPLKEVKYLAESEYSSEFTNLLNEARKMPIDKKLRALEEVKKKIEDSNADVFNFESKEKGIIKLKEDEAVTMRKGIESGLKKARTEALEKVEKEIKEVKKEAKKRKFTFFNPREKPKKLEVTLFSPFSKKKRKPAATLESKNEARMQLLRQRRRVEREVPKLVKEFAGYITKNPIMRREIANTFNLKSGNPHVVEKFLESEEFKGKVIGRYEKSLSKGTKRFLTDLQRLEEKKE